jgi:S1-C subfamily serine protease
MPLKKHHKWIIGSFSTLILIIVLLNSFFLYTMFVRQNVNFNSLNQKITDLKTDTQTKINSLSETVLSFEEELTSLGSQVGSIDSEINLLKASTSEDFSGIIEDSVKSVVTIKTDVSQGTGFIIDEDGYVVTNAHVMEGAKAAAVITYDGEQHSVALTGTDTQMDIALLKIAGTYEKLALGDSDDVSVGEKVIAIGNPLGLQFSVSEGIISAIHREGVNGLEAYIQTDAALNPGNSGGPLIDKQGEVVGINNFKIGEGENLGFALESDYVKDTVNEIYDNEVGGTLI